MTAADIIFRVLFFVAGVACGYLAIVACMRQESLQDRVNGLLYGVKVDVIILLILLFVSGYVRDYMMYLIGKYVFLALVDMEKTLKGD